MPKINELPNDSQESQLMDLVRTMQKELQELKQQQTPAVQTKNEHYKGPLSFSYKIWGDNIVTDYESVKKDKTRDLHYKNSKGEYIDNHYVKLTYANGKQEEVLLYDFNMGYTSSEHQNVGAIYIENGKEERVKLYETKHSLLGIQPTHYIFTVDGEEVIVSSKIVN